VVRLDDLDQAVRELRGERKTEGVSAFARLRLGSSVGEEAVVDEDKVVGEEAVVEDKVVGKGLELTSSLLCFEGAGATASVLLRQSILCP
jgi:hypothetical protein